MLKALEQRPQAEIREVVVQTKGTSVSVGVRRLHAFNECITFVEYPLLEVQFKWFVDMVA